jgi:hypothetical protein
MLALQRAGLDILLPFGENTRYDLVIDDGRRLARVQCKTGRLRAGAIRFPACSCYGHHRNPSTARRDYQGQIDYFGVYCAATSGVYLLPIESAPAKAVIALRVDLRVDPPRNNQKRRIRYAAEYRIATVRLAA